MDGLFEIPKKWEYGEAIWGPPLGQGNAQYRDVAVGGIHFGRRGMQVSEGYSSPISLTLATQEISSLTI